MPSAPRGRKRGLGHNQVEDLSVPGKSLRPFVSQVGRAVVVTDHERAREVDEEAGLHDSRDRIESQLQLGGVRDAALEVDVEDLVAVVGQVGGALRPPQLRCTAKRPDPAFHRRPREGDDLDGEIKRGPLKKNQNNF